MESSKVVVHFAVTLANAIDKVLADNKVDLMDVPALMAPLMQVGPFAAALHPAVVEYKASTPEQKVELIAQVKSELDLKSDRTEEIVAKALDLTVAIADLVKLVKA